MCILTDLRSEDVESILSPIVKAERETERYYDNDSLVQALRDAFPYKVIEHFVIICIAYFIAIQLKLHLFD